MSVSCTGYGRLVSVWGLQWEGEWVTAGWGLRESISYFVIARRHGKFIFISIKSSRFSVFICLGF